MQNGLAGYEFTDNIIGIALRKVDVANTIKVNYKCSTDSLYII